MGRKILINADHPEESRIAIVEDGVLVEYEVEFTGKEQNKGNIYKGVVVNVVPALQAAFVDYGAERPGFLQSSDINWRLLRGNGETPPSGAHRIERILKTGQELLVQVIKDARGSKGAALTTELSLPGRFMVLMPYGDARGVSRKIDDEAQRKKIKEAMASLDLPENLGYIVRTAAIGQKKEELKKDIDYLQRIHEKVQELAAKAKAPALIYQESNLVIRFLRDYFSTDMDSVLVDNPQVYQQAVDFFKDMLPDYAGLVKLHREKRPIFSRYQLEEQIATIAKNKVLLPSGGSIVIDVTEALVSIDVNSGKTLGEGNIEGTAFKTNIEAVAEIARQLRLRDLGGLIVLDLIDMKDRAHIRDVEKGLKEALKKDKARVNLSRISKFGLLELSRQRIKPTLGEQSFILCPHCQGSGRLKRTEAQAVTVLRRLGAALIKDETELVEGELHLETALYLLNEKRAALTDLERKYQTRILLKGRADVPPDHFELTVRRKDKTAAEAEGATPAIEAPAVAERETATPTLEPEKKKTPRKRSRRGKSAAKKEPAVGETAAPSESKPPEPPLPEPPPTPAPIPETEAPAPGAEKDQASGPEAESAPAEKPQRPASRSRRGGRRKPKKEPLPASQEGSSAAAISEPAQSEASPPENVAPIPEPIAGEEKNAELPKKPAARRPRRRTRSGGKKKDQPPHGSGTGETEPAEAQKNPEGVPSGSGTIEEA
ncbi:MAG: Rne/Rng family ribonuclease [Deltaproteobacteria bacterium]|nr:Rne/Rng family ribonuclease [Deltaproteobacteria bacterium]